MLLILPSFTAITSVESGDKAIAVMFIVLSTGRVSDLLLKIKTITCLQINYFGFPFLNCIVILLEQNIWHTHFFRSKIEILLPTGLITEFPSAVNDRLPLWYTVPNRLQNWNNPKRAYFTGLKTELIYVTENKIRLIRDYWCLRFTCDSCASH